jgi:hypothetical protein
MYGSSSIDVQDALHTAMPEKLEEWFAWHKVHAGIANRVDLFTRLASNMLKSNLPVDRAYIHSHIIEAAGSAGCLSEAWVSAHRFAWIDLTAGQFTWGTGTGSKSVDSFPHVASDFLSRASPSLKLDKESSVNIPVTHLFLLFAVGSVVISDHHAAESGAKNYRGSNGQSMRFGPKGASCSDRFAK